MLVDINVMCALDQFLRKGWMPGSFGEALLLQDRVTAYARAHPNLKGNEDIVGNMLSFVSDNLPASMFETYEDLLKWSSHMGLYGCSDETKNGFLAFNMLIGNKWFFTDPTSSNYWKGDTYGDLCEM